MKYNSKQIKAIQDNIAHYTNLVDLFLEDKETRKRFLECVILKNETITSTLELMKPELNKNKDKFSGLIEVAREMRAKHSNTWEMETVIVYNYLEDVISSYKEEAINFLTEKSEMPM